MDLFVMLLRWSKVPCMTNAGLAHRILLLHNQSVSATTLLLSSAHLRCRIHL